MKIEKTIKYITLASAVAHSAFYLVIVGLVAHSLKLDLVSQAALSNKILSSMSFIFPIKFMPLASETGLYYVSFVAIAALLALTLAALSIAKSTLRYSLFSAALLMLFSGWAWFVAVPLLVLLGLREKYLSCEAAYMQAKEQSERDINSVVFVGAMLLGVFISIFVGLALYFLIFDISNVSMQGMSFVHTKGEGLARTTVSLPLLAFLVATCSLALIWTVLGRRKKIAFQYSLYAMALFVLPAGFIFAAIVFVILGVREKMLTCKSLDTFS